MGVKRGRDDGAEVEYEKLRNDRLRENQKRMEELGILGLSKSLAESVRPARPPPRCSAAIPRVIAAAGPARRSSRYAFMSTSFLGMPALTICWSGFCFFASFVSNAGYPRNFPFLLCESIEAPPYQALSLFFCTRPSIVCCVVFLLRVFGVYPYFSLT